MAKDVEKKPKKEGKHFFKDFKAELKKVIWPTPKQVVNNTIAVITIVLITAVIVFALDFVFKAINTYGINSIRNIVKNDNSIDETETSEYDSETNTLTTQIQLDELTDEFEAESTGEEQSTENAEQGSIEE